MPIKVGDVLEDNDPRMPLRTLKVLAVGDAKAVCESAPGRRVMVSLTRIFTDGKPRKWGFSVRQEQRPSADGRAEQQGRMFAANHNKNAG